MNGHGQLPKARYNRHVVDGREIVHIDFNNLARDFHGVLGCIEWIVAGTAVSGGPYQVSRFRGEIQVVYAVVIEERPAHIYQCAHFLGLGTSLGPPFLNGIDMVIRYFPIAPLHV